MAATQGMATLALLTRQAEHALGLLDLSRLSPAELSRLDALLVSSLEQSQALTAFLRTLEPPPSAEIAAIWDEANADIIRNSEDRSIAGYSRD